MSTDDETMHPVRICQPADEFWPDHIDGRVHVVHDHAMTAELCNVRCCAVASLDGVVERLDG